MEDDYEKFLSSSDKTPAISLFTFPVPVRGYKDQTVQVGPSRAMSATVDSLISDLLLSSRLCLPLLAWNSPHTSHIESHPNAAKAASYPARRTDELERERPREAAAPVGKASPAFYLMLLCLFPPLARLFFPSLEKTWVRNYNALSQISNKENFLSVVRRDTSHLPFTNFLCYSLPFFYCLTH